VWAYALDDFAQPAVAHRPQDQAQLCEVWAKIYGSVLKNRAAIKASRRRRGGRLPPLTDAALVRADGRRMGRVGTISELIRRVFGDQR